MELAKLVLEYIQALIWPSLLLILLWRYRNVLDVLTERLKEADEVGAWGLTWKLRHRLEEISASLPAESRGQLDKQVARLALDELRVVARDLETKPLAERQRAAQAVKQLAPEIPLEVMLGFAESPLFGERVAAVIVLSYLLRADGSKLRQDPRLRAVLRNGLQDPNSRVRYRYAELLKGQPQLANEFREMLEEIAAAENNGPVLKLVREALNNAG